MLQIKDLALYIDEYDIEMTGIDFSVAEKDFFVIFGPDYSGKTELLHAVMGLRRTESGEILYRENDINQMSLQERREIRYVPDSVLLEENTTVEEYIVQMLSAYETEADMLLDALLEMFDIDLDEEITNMTFEKNKLVTIIAALMTAPKLILLDEPFNFLSERSTKKLLEILKMYNEQGMTVVVVSEHYEDVKGHANRYAFIKEGRLVSAGDSKKSFDKIRKLTVGHGEVAKMNKQFKKPIRIGEDTATYLYAKSLRELADILEYCEVDEQEVVIEQARLEEILSLD